MEPPVTRQALLLARNPDGAVAALAVALPLLGEVALGLGSRELLSQLCDLSGHPCHELIKAPARGG